jgi:2-methylcitrate dehydratase PrpD
MTTMSTEKLAAFVAGTATAAIPPALLAKARGAFVDTLGVALVGASDEAAVIAQRGAEETGARPVSRILGTALATSPAEAAFANGIAAHVLDFDDSLPSMRGHPSATLVPVVLAVGEAVGASGREALAAYVLAIEIGGKLGRALGHHHYLHGWHSTATVGAFTATAAAARLWKLSPAQLANAWGITASMSAGLVRNFGTMTKPFHTGHAARVGVSAAWMAKEGFTADPAILEGKGGFLDVYAFGDGETLDAVAGTLGAPWEMEKPGIFVKGWPCCYCNHRALGGLFDLMSRETILADDVEEIAVGFAPGSDRALIKDDPQTGLEAKFSIEYAMAAAVLDGALGLDSFTDEQVRRPAVRALMKRVRRYQVPAEGVFSGVVGFTDLVVKAAGRTHEMHIDRVPGSPEWPLSEANRHAKFLDCAGRALGAEAAANLLALIERTEELPEIAALSRAAQPAVALKERVRA